MPNIRIRHLSPTPEFPGPWSGLAPSARIPLRHLEAWVQDARRRILAGAVTDEDKARAMREVVAASVRKAMQAGVRIGFGTDSSVVPFASTGRDTGEDFPDVPPPYGVSVVTPVQKAADPVRTMIAPAVSP